VDYLDFVIGIGGFALTAIATLLTVAFHKSARPLYLFDISKFGGIKHPDIGITFKGDPVPNLYVLRFVLWNAGKKEIRSEDLPNQKAAPRIKFDERSKVLSQIAYSSAGDDTGKISFSKNNEACLTFDYLNKDDALIGEIYFSSTDEKNAEFEFLGTIKGAKVKEGLIESRTAANIIGPLVVSGILVFSTFGYASTAFPSFTKGPIWLDIFTIVFFSSLAVAAVLSIRFNVQRIPFMVPEKYKEFLVDGLDSDLGLHLYNNRLHSDRFSTAPRLQTGA